MSFSVQPRSSWVFVFPFVWMGLSTAQASPDLEETQKISYASFTQRESAQNETEEYPPTALLTSKEELDSPKALFPLEIYAHIISFLDLKGLYKMAQVNQDLYKLAEPWFKPYYKRAISNSEILHPHLKERILNVFENPNQGIIIDPFLYEKDQVRALNLFPYYSPLLHFYPDVGLILIYTTLDPQECQALSRAKLKFLGLFLINGQGIDLVPLASNPFLRQLCISHVNEERRWRIQDLLIQALSLNTTLKALTFKGDIIGEEGIRTLARSQTLEALNLEDNNQLSKEAKEELRKSSPIKNFRI